MPDISAHFCTLNVKNVLKYEVNPLLLVPVWNHLLRIFKIIGLFVLQNDMDYLYHLVII